MLLSMGHKDQLYFLAKLSISLSGDPIALTQAFYLQANINKQTNKQTKQYSIFSFLINKMAQITPSADIKAI